MKLFYYSPRLLASTPHRGPTNSASGRDGEIDLRTQYCGRIGLLQGESKGYVPLLVLADGTTLTEANVVLNTSRTGNRALAEIRHAGALEAHGDARLPRHGSAQGLQRAVEPETPAEVRAAAVERLGTRFALLSQTLAKQPFLMGDKFTIADAYFFVLLNWTNIHKVDLTPWPALKDYQARVAARPAVQATLKAEGLVK